MLSLSWPGSQAADQPTCTRTRTARIRNPHFQCDQGLTSGTRTHTVASRINSAATRTRVAGAGQPAGGNMIRNGARFPVTMAQVFPHGCHLMPDSITEAQDYDEKTKTRSPATDKLTGKRVFQCRVADMDPELEGRSRE